VLAVDDGDAAAATARCNMYVPHQRPHNQAAR